MKVARTVWGSRHSISNFVKRGGVAGRRAPSDTPLLSPRISGRHILRIISHRTMDIRAQQDAKVSE